MRYPPDILVIGAGYWGVAVALLAEARGATVQLIDNGDTLGASRAASAHFAFSWYRGPWRARIERAVDRAQLVGFLLRRTGALTHRGRTKEDWWTFRPDDLLGLRRPDIIGDVTEVDHGALRVRVGSSWLPARNIVIAAGAWADDLLRRSRLPEVGVTGLPGAGIVVVAAKPDEYGAAVFLHELNPFKQVAFREWGPGLVRYGETTEQRPGPAAVAQYVAKLRAIGDQHLGSREPRQIIRGIRPVVKTGPQVKLVAPNIVAATGGGRIGALLSFWAAEETCRLLMLL